MPTVKDRNIQKLRRMKQKRRQTIENLAEKAEALANGRTGRQLEFQLRISSSDNRDAE